MSRKTDRTDLAWKEDLIFLAAVAEQLEAIEYGSMARLLRVATEFLLRRAAFEKDLSSRPEEMEEMLKKAGEILSRHHVGQKLESAFEEGLEHFRRGERYELDDSPLPLVCRSCGGRFLPKF